MCTYYYYCFFQLFIRTILALLKDLTITLVSEHSDVELVVLKKEHFCANPGVFISEQEWSLNREVHTGARSAFLERVCALYTSLCGCLVLL